MEAMSAEQEKICIYAQFRLEIFVLLNLYFDVIAHSHVTALFVVYTVHWRTCSLFN